MGKRAQLRGQRGQTVVEYMGVLVVVAVIIAALATSGLPGELEVLIRQKICQVAEGESNCSEASVRRDVRRARRLDRDDDDLSNKREKKLGTDPRKSDTDGDGLADGYEVDHDLNPKSRDSDKDGRDDGVELRENIKKDQKKDKGDRKKPARKPQHQD
jgi:hypothetical protein